MKYITFSPPGRMDFAVIFSPHIAHSEIAERIGHPVRGAGFIRLSETAPKLHGYSTSLRKGVDPLDASLIAAAITLNAA